MIVTSKPLYVYLQRPDTGEWVTVGRYLRHDDPGIGIFRYAPSYERAGLAWSIDPVNLPYAPDREYTALRYRGLHDALRDACPDAWGRMLLQREHGIPLNAPDHRYLYHSSNADRWGALAVGLSKTPSIANLSSPCLPQLDLFIAELRAIARHAPPVNAALRKRLVSLNSLGGARPKVTVQDKNLFWLVKPLLHTDAADIPLLEHAAHQWASAAKLNFAATVLHHVEGVSAVRVLRFDRNGC